jgi:hypothetical protein
MVLAGSVAVVIATHPGCGVWGGVGGILVVLVVGGATLPLGHAGRRAGHLVRDDGRTFEAG